MRIPDARTYININDLHISLHGQSILNGVSFSIKQPECVVVLGPNGAGKSSLLKAVSAELHPSRECISLFDTPRSQWKNLELSLAKKMAVLPQSSQLSFDFLVEDVVQLGRMPHSTGVAKDEAVVRAVMEQMDVSYLHNKPYTQLSGGEKQRVQLARVLAQIWPEKDEVSVDKKSPRRLLLLDEPTSSLDVAHQHVLMRSMLELKSKGVAVIMVLHDFNLAAQYADRILVIHDKKLSHDGSPASVLSTDMMRTVFNIDATILTHPTTSKPIVTVV